MEQKAMTEGTTRPDLAAARQAAAFGPLSDYGWLRLTGRDRLDLLNRLSTNDLRKLAAGEGLPTVLTNPMGRVLAFLLVYAGDEAAHVRLMPDQAAAITRYLSGMIFFQDQVEVNDLTETTAQFALYGPRAGDLLARLTNMPLGLVGEHHWRAGVLGGAAVSIHRGGPLEPWQWTVVADAPNRDRVQVALAGGAVRLQPETADLLRIEAGLPLWGRELSDGVTPLETGLLPAVSFIKGCYTGQEVIARQTNYDKVTRNLVGLVFEDAPEAGASGLTVRGPGRGGFVGSVAYSPTRGRVIGLAVVPRDLAQPNTAVEVEADGRTYRATVTGLPFEG